MKASIDFIHAIASNMPEADKPLSDIKATLEDGQALLYLGATDDDQPMIECAHAIVSDWMNEGKKYL